MSFQAGREKTGGRKEGTPNKTTKELKSFLIDFLDHNSNKLQECFNTLYIKHPERAIGLFIKMSKLVLPQSNKDMPSSEKGNYDSVIIIDRYKEESDSSNIDHLI